MKHRGLEYRPALDGLRAVAVLAVIIFHGRPGWLPGGWLGVDLFFVISGFLITTLLVSEQADWGRVDLMSFWAARARRLFPALALVLVAVLVLSARYTPPGRRGAVSDDVVSTVAYVANWRFLLSDEGYFAAIATPSPVRHAWSLAVEEQFYLLYPLLLIAICAAVGRRRGLVVVLAVLALASAWWMAHLYVPDVDPARVYYGTDTRAQELLVGAVLAAAVASSVQWRTRIERFARIAAAPAVVLVFAAFFRVDEETSWMFRGGLLGFSVLAGLVVVAAWSTTSGPVARALAFEPLRRVGAMSYGLYLWHWPVLVFATEQRVGVGGLTLFALQLLVTFALAAASLRLVERPIRSGGFRALVPRRPRMSLVVAMVTVPVVLLGAGVLPSVTSYASTGGRDLRVDEPPYRPRSETSSVMLMGDSVPISVFEAFPPNDYPDIQLSGNAYIGCDPFPGRRVLDGAVDAPTVECQQWAKDWPTSVEQVKPDLVALFTPRSLMLDREVDGQLLVAKTPAHDEFVAQGLNRLRRQVMALGAGRFAVVTIACHRQPVISDSEEVIRTNDDSAAEHLNAAVAQWAASRDVAVVDQYGLLCTGGYHETINGILLYGDYLHYSRESGAVFWTWLAPRLRAAATSG